MDVHLVLILLIFGISVPLPVRSVVPVSDYPCHPAWTYSDVSGNCYLIQPSRKDQASAIANCTTALATFTEMNGKVSLGKIRTADDAKALSHILASVANYEMQWTSGAKSGPTAPYMWSDGTAVSTNSDLWNPSPGTQDCLIYEHRPMNPANTWSTYFSMKSENCSRLMAYYCEHPAKSCASPTSTLVPNYDATSMMLFPERTTVSSLIRVVCRPGFYRYSELSYATTLTPPTASTMLPDQINCTGSAGNDYNPELYTPMWNARTLEICLPIKCTIMNGSLNNVENQPRISPGEQAAKFPYGYEFHVNCSLGYVNYLNRTRIDASMMCGQSQEDKSQGLWVPEDYNACIGVKCNKTEMELMKPTDGKLFKAKHKITQREYKEFEVNQFNQYDNIVTIRCAEGYFFPDRSFEKRIVCGLKEGSRIDGQWFGYSGNVLPMYKECKPVECQSEKVLLESKLLLEPWFLISYPNGSVFNRTTHNGLDYPYRTILRFFCIDGYDTANKNQDLNVTCGREGSWVPQLTACIQTTEKLSTGSKKFFVPAAEEAPAAKEVGVIVIVILIIFLVLIIILDLSTVTRDIKNMRKNLKHLRRYLSKKKQKNAE